MEHQHEVQSNMAPMDDMEMIQTNPNEFQLNIALSNMTLNTDEEHMPGSRRPHHIDVQIQELERYFDFNIYPDEHQCHELGQRLGLTTGQVECWFDNRRAYMMKKRLHLENLALEMEIKRLRMENRILMESMADVFCEKCLHGNCLRVEHEGLEDELRFVQHYFGRDTHGHGASLSHDHEASSSRGHGASSSRGHEASSSHDQGASLSHVHEASSSHGKNDTTKRGG